MAAQLAQQKAKYAELIVRAGLNLQPGQRLQIAGSAIAGVDPHLAPFVRLIAAAAYRAGAPLVDVIWDDPRLHPIRLREATPETLGQHSDWPIAAHQEFLDKGGAFLGILAGDPDLLSGIDPKLVSAVVNPLLESARPVVAQIEGNAVNWCVASAPIPSWATKVFPSLPPAKREGRLWEVILQLCRADQPDPVALWLSLGKDLATRAAYLNARQYSSLTFKGPGTDLTVGLPPRHVWLGGQNRAKNGVVFLPNIPTEEVYTLPHRSRVDGSVQSTKPLNLFGSTIEGFRLVFRDGKVTEFAARKGEAHLRELIETHEGASRLGEVALVPASSPISRMGIVLWNALFDENAASHLALGSAYRDSLKGGGEISEEEFAEAGGNASAVHVDFMIGSSEVDVDGVTPQRTLDPIMRKGEWAFPT